MLREPLSAYVNLPAVGEADRREWLQLAIGRGIQLPSTSILPWRTANDCLEGAFGFIAERGGKKFHSSGLQHLPGWSIRVRLTLESHQAGYCHIAPRASQKMRAFFIGLLFQNRHDEDKAVKCIQ
jgi:hypothetical protein